MAHQALRNASVSSGDRQNNGVIEGMSSVGNDLATLIVLQTRLAACDLRDSARVATPILAGMTFFGIIAAASVVIGLMGVALWLAAILNIQPYIVMMLVALAGLVISLAGSALLARSLTRCFTYFRRSQEELERNLEWVKTTLLHSGR
jgi:sensor histidine kinase regulating citrate/malate metabolism